MVHHHSYQLLVSDGKQQSSDIIAQSSIISTSKSHSLSPRNCAIPNNVFSDNRKMDSSVVVGQDHSTKSNPASNHFTSDKHNSVTSVQDLNINPPSCEKPIEPMLHSAVSNVHTDSVCKDNTQSVYKATENQRIPKPNKPSNQSFNSQPHWNQNNSNQLTPREGNLKPPINQGAKRQNGGKPVWKGKPVIYDCDRSSRSPLPHSVPDGLDESLIFESRFESGNLRQVRRM